jgi:hypothetical protein
MSRLEWEVEFTTSRRKEESLSFMISDQKASRYRLCVKPRRPKKAALPLNNNMNTYAVETSLA